MKKTICIILLLLFCSSCASTNGMPVIHQSSPMPLNGEINLKNTLDKQDEKTDVKRNTNTYTPLNYQEQNAVWISYIDLQPMILGKSENEFEKNISTAYKKIKELGCNTVYVHVRSFGDAYYNSELYPYSKGITGEIDTEPDFDPLKIMIKEAHDLGLSFHAWINPMRCETEENMKEISNSYVIKQWYSDSNKYDEYLVKVDSDNHYWLNPAVDDVRNLIAQGAAEIVKNYDVDGIHIDDYFYPTTEAYFDSGIYVETGVKESLSEWRKNNVSKMVKEIYNSIKKENSEVLFGVSPQGNMENNYEFMYADVKTWCSEEGYLDYIVPQIYFGFENNSKPFVQTTEEWSNIVTCDNVSLVIGLGVYKIGQEDEFLQSTGIIGKQINLSQNMKNYGGIALYNYINLFEPEENLAERTNAELSCIKDAISD
ncbi:MAG: family 10 glycosylhydrolase [Ruminococcus sp.]|nr:family 10 glycosylhydrolase [Ruminococcus sp.]